MRAPRNLYGAQSARATLSLGVSASFRSSIVRSLAALAAVLAFAPDARAQFAPPGGFAPYSIIAPEAGAAGSAAAATNNSYQNQDCYVQARGRSAPQSQCQSRQPPEPKK